MQRQYTNTNPAYIYARNEYLEFEKNLIYNKTQSNEIFNQICAASIC